jgi:hypothetical protein
MDFGRPETVTAVATRVGIPKLSEITTGTSSIILLAHAERHREIWNNQSPRFLAFGSSKEASHRLAHLLLEASRWEGIDVPARVEIEPDRFHFVRQRDILCLNVDVNGLLYRELPTVTADRKAWDWGEETRGNSDRLQRTTNRRRQAGYIDPRMPTKTAVSQAAWRATAASAAVLTRGSDVTLYCDCTQKRAIAPRMATGMASDP